MLGQRNKTAVQLPVLKEGEGEREGGGGGRTPAEERRLSILSNFIEFITINTTCTE